MRAEAAFHQSEYDKLAVTLETERAQVSEENARLEAEKVDLQARLKEAEEASRIATKQAELAEQACRDSKDHEKKMLEQAEASEKRAHEFENKVFNFQAGLAVANFVKDGFFKLLEMVFNYVPQNNNDEPQPVEGEPEEPAVEQEDEEEV
jgi:hypothetical protein